MKKIIFISLILLITIFSSCKKKRKPVTETTPEWLEQEVVVDNDEPLRYGGILLQLPTSWSSDTSKVDDGTYNITIFPTGSHNDREVVINIHDTQLNKQAYMEQLKKRVTQTPKTRNANFTAPASKPFYDWNNSYQCNFYSPSSDIRGKIIIIEDQQNKRTYSIFYKGYSYFVEGADLDYLLKSFRSIKK